MPPRGKRRALGRADEHHNAAAVPVRPTADHRYVPSILFHSSLDYPLMTGRRWVSNDDRVDDEENVNSLAPHAALGEIEVSIVRIRAEYRSVPHTMGRFQPVGAVHERSKKAGVHCVSCVSVSYRWDILDSDWGYGHAG